MHPDIMREALFMLKPSLMFKAVMKQDAIIKIKSQPFYDLPLVEDNGQVLKWRTVNASRTPC